MRECVQDYIEKVKKDYLRKLDIYEKKYWDGEIRIKRRIYGNPGLSRNLMELGLLDGLTNAEEEAINTYRYYEVINRDVKIEKRVRKRRKPVTSTDDLGDEFPDDILKKIQDGDLDIGDLAVHEDIPVEEVFEEVFQEVSVDYTYIKLFNKVTPKLSDEEFEKLIKYSQITDTLEILYRLDELDEKLEEKLEAIRNRI